MHIIICFFVPLSNPPPPTRPPLTSIFNSNQFRCILIRISTYAKCIISLQRISFTLQLIRQTHTHEQHNNNNKSHGICNTQINIYLFTYCYWQQRLVEVVVVDSSSNRSTSARIRFIAIDMYLLHQFEKSVRLLESFLYAHETDCGSIALDALFKTMGLRMKWKKISRGCSCV